MFSRIRAPTLFTRRNNRPQQTQQTQSDPRSRLSMRTKSFTNRKKLAKKEGKVASFAGQIAHTAGLAAPVIAIAAAVGLSVSVPAVVPAALSVGFVISMLLRQKSLNSELKSHIGYIQLEIERMLLTIRVIQVIAKERGIPLNTTNLSLSIQGITKKLMTLADKDTARAIERINSEDDVNIARLHNAAKSNGKSLLRSASQEVLMVQQDQGQNQGQNQGGGAFLPERVSKFLSTWVSPSETIRQISNDLTIALGWYSIMMSEFEIFMKYMDIKNVQPATIWKDGREMTSLIASYRNVEGFQTFLMQDEIVQAVHIAASAVGVVEKTAEEMKQSQNVIPQMPLSQMPSSRSPSPLQISRTNSVTSVLSDYPPKTKPNQRNDLWNNAI